VEALEWSMNEVGDARVALEWIGRFETGAAIRADQNRHDIQYRRPPARFPLNLPANLDRTRGVALVPTDALLGSLRGAVEPAPDPNTTVNTAAVVTDFARAGSS
jgi:hypothetical protein